MIVLVLTALLTIVPLVPLLAIPAAGAIAVLTVLAWRRRQQAAASLGLFSVTCIGLTVAGVGPLQVLFPIAIATYFIVVWRVPWLRRASSWRSEEHTSELQSRLHLVCRLLLEKKKKQQMMLRFTYQTEVSFTCVM